MKILYYGGQKSGKSKCAEAKTLELASPKKPYYLATYNNSYRDEEMQQRINLHQQQRADRFISIEEPIEISSCIQKNNSYLIDCISMWILNTLELESEELFKELELLSEKDAHIVFVLNDVNSGVIPLERESRKFVDRSGVVGQKLAEMCDEVYEVKLGLTRRLK